MTGEHIITSHEEYQRWKQIWTSRPTLVGSLVLATRYANLSAMAVIGVWLFGHSPKEHCGAIVGFIVVAMTLSYVSSTTGRLLVARY